MGIFSRRRTTAVAPEPSWQPGADEIIVAPGYAMEGECAGDHAFGAQFALETAPDSILTIWAFPAGCGAAAPGHYWVAYRTDYMVTDADGDETWAVSLYGGDLAHAEWYGDPGAAADAARAAAADLVRNGAAATAQHATPGTVAGWFDWHGSPWSQ